MRQTLYRHTLPYTLTTLINMHVCPCKGRLTQCNTSVKHINTLSNLCDYRQIWQFASELIAGCFFGLEVNFTFRKQLFNAFFNYYQRALSYLQKFFKFDNSFYRQFTALNLGSAARSPRLQLWMINLT
jgi:hypothetical protein